MPTKRLLIIGFSWPEPNASAAGSRMLQLIRFFIAEHYEITLASTAKFPEHPVDWNGLGVQTVSILLNDASFDDFLKTIRPDVVLFDRYLTEEQFGWRIAQQLPQALRILDTEDLHSLRKSRRTVLEKGGIFETSDWLNNDITKRELASIYRCDVSLIISSFEMELLQNRAGVSKSLLLWLPFMVEKLTLEKVAAWPVFETRKHFMFIGTGRHAPNVDAVIQLKRHLWPAIREILPNAELHIYGSYLPQQLTEMHRPSDSFMVMGNAENVSLVMHKYRLQLVPLRFGAGIKGKLFDSMRNGLPSVTTTIGAEGMGDGLLWNGAVCDDWEAFVQQAVRLYQLPKAWRTAQNNGKSLMNTNYDSEVHAERFRSKIGTLIQQLRLHRTNNIIGGMLMHHTMASTKYLSKWIEEKNNVPSLADGPLHKKD
ncbi:glycosyltransferase [Maribacter sp. 2-571]|uniref:glycosyltransferase n=1 Tax=Maribacter sp. 2-571 TaxID=3417569 RepID=UPI003D334FC3